MKKATTGTCRSMTCLGVMARVSLTTGLVSSWNSLYTGLRSRPSASKQVEHTLAQQEPARDLHERPQHDDEREVERHVKFGEA